jgi:signal transduction histidine kinase
MLLVAPRADAAILGRWVPEADVNRGATRRFGLIGAMALVVALVAGLAYWDAARESARALDELAEAQATLARALVPALRTPAGLGDDDARLGRLRGVERPKALAVLLHRAGETVFRMPDGGRIHSPPLLEAVDHGETSVRIPRDEAGVFGLPPRMAVAGIARVVEAGPGEQVITVASAAHERDRAAWARRRLVLSVLAAAGLVVVFGGVAMRNQRKELLLERELAVTAVRQARDDRLERASRAAVMGTLAMGVAHEISTPLGVIAARAEQLGSRAGADERLTGGAAAILAQTDRIKQVIQGLLGLARGDAPSAERIDPRAVVEQAVGLVEHRFAKAGVGLGREVEPGLPGILGDPRLLEHAVVNLLLNACDASRPGDSVTVRARRTAPDVADVEIVVDDEGVGISAADLGRAREPFFTTKARGEGTGLGLAIAHEIVASHRGRLELAPRSPRGTEAVIRLPPAQEGGRADA